MECINVQWGHGINKPKSLRSKILKVINLQMRVVQELRGVPIIYVHRIF